MNEETSLEQRLFAEALTLPPDERSGFLRARCGGDEALQQAIEELLEAHEKASRLLPTSFDANMPLASGMAGEEPGTSIGRYKLLQKIGVGGMGVVYMAEQSEPITRKVALKIIKLGMDTREVVARFEAERQALAMMDHPNIARVLDAGCTEAGRPFFVMEMVKGVPITRFCDEGRLSQEDRLRLFIDVCSAIQHAHQKGIIHRDIKPSNIMVTLHGDHPVAKVIDFGIAKATQGRLTDKTLFTRYEQVIGTPAYMSPEQTSLSGLDIDTRSDIYSLGVLLYELLTGKTPFDPTQLLSGGFDELRRKIREEDPPRPSTRVSTLAFEEQDSLAKVRRLGTREFSARIQGELDWIVMRAIDKDRSRRYETADALALDVRRHLNGEAVTAVPPSRSYQLRKFARKHRVALSVGGAFAALMMAATAVSGWFAWQLNQANAEVRQKAEEARLEADKSAEVLQFFNRDILGAADPAQKNRKELTLRQALDLASERVGSRKFRHPLVESEVLMALGRTYQGLGWLEKAFDHFQRALRLQREVLGESKAQTANTLLSLARVQGDRLDMAQCRALAMEAIRVIRSQDPVDEPLLLEAYQILMGLDFRCGVPLVPGFIEQFESMIRTAEERFPETWDLKASLYGIYGVIQAQYGRYDKAAEAFQRDADICRTRTLYRDPIRANNEAILHMALGDTAKAIEVAVDAARLLDERPDSPEPWEIRLGKAKGTALIFQGRSADAERYMADLCDRMKSQPAHGWSVEDLTSNWGLRAEALLLLGQPAKARAILEELESSDFPEYLKANHLNSISVSYGMEGRLEEASRVMEGTTKETMLPRKAILVARLGQSAMYRQFLDQMTEAYRGWEDRLLVAELLRAFGATPEGTAPARQPVVRQWMRAAEKRVSDSLAPLADQLRLGLALAHFRLGERDAAERFVRSLSPDHPNYRVLAHALRAHLAADPSDRAHHLAQATSGRHQWIEADLARSWQQEAWIFDLLLRELNPVATETAGSAAPISRASPR